MPTVLRIGPYRFFFFAGDRNEPLHIHIEREDKVRNSGLIRLGYKVAVVFHVAKSAVF